MDAYIMTTFSTEKKKLFYIYLLCIVWFAYSAPTDVQIAEK